MNWTFVNDVVEDFKGGEIDLNEGKKSTISFAHDKTDKVTDCEEIHKAKEVQDFERVNDYYYSEKDLNIRSKYTRKCKPHLRKNEIKCDEGTYLDETKYDTFIKSKRNQPVTKEAVCVDHPATITCGTGQLFDTKQFEDKRNNYKSKMTDEYIQSSKICYDDVDYLRLKFINDELNLKKTVEIDQKDITNMLNHYYDVFRV